jgi:hypothetical protein
MQNNGGGFQTLIEHWDGTQWSVAAQPVTGGLQAVAAISASDIWAVGTVIEHYDGSSWSVFPSSVSGALNGVVAISSNDVWAVGENFSEDTQIEHWDGSIWSLITHPDPPGAGFLGFNAVAASSANDVWAVGFYNGGGTNFTLIEHWNGTQWSIVPGPKLKRGNANLFSVTALSAQDAWAVGYAGKRALIEHWNGKAWKNTKQKFGGTINAIAAVSATNIWAVGSAGINTLTEHWDGTQWSFVTTPPPPPNVIYRAMGVAVASANDIWMVGDSTHEQNPSYQTLTEFYC